MYEKIGSVSWDCVVVVVVVFGQSLQICHSGNEGVGQGEGALMHKTPWWGLSDRPLRWVSSLPGRSCPRPSSSCGRPAGG